MLIISIFSLFPQCFLALQKQISIFETGLFFRLQMFSIWTILKFCHLVELKDKFTLDSDACWTKQINPLPNMPVLDSFSSTANKDRSKLWTNGDTDI